jgi:hypothetical protein
MGPGGLTFEFTRGRKQAKPAVARRVQRRVSPRSMRYWCEEQHGDDNCTGGQATLPNEQKTQQCPGSGRSSAPHDLHW